MTSKRKTVHWIIAVVLALAVIAAGMTASRHAADPVCTRMTIIIKDSTERRYVSVGELQQQLNQAGLWQVGQPLSHISCRQIEQHLLTHPMLRKAECYELANGTVHIVVHQRQPLMLVKGDELYYLDTDRKVMPARASVNTPVIVVSGRIGKQQAQGEMYDFVEWLTESRYWHNKIRDIHVVTPKMIELTDSTHNYTLIIGALDGAEGRLNQLEKLYEEGFEKIGYPKYKQIDLQYKNQIIGRK